MQKKHYVLDTCTLLDNPNSIEILRNGTQNEIYIPITVILELRKLKSDNRLYPIVAQVLDNIEKTEYAKFLKPPSKKHTNDNDQNILTEIEESNIEHPILVTNDRGLRILAKIKNINTEEFTQSLPYTSEAELYTGFINSGDEFISNSFSLVDGKFYFNGQYNKDEPILIDHDNEIWKVKPKNIYQNLALELMLKDHIDIVTLQSEAGHGKSFLSLAAALYLVFEKKKYDKIYLIKPILEISNSLGYLPGDIEDKLNPHVRYLINLISKLHHTRKSKCSDIFMPESTISRPKLNPSKFEILPIQYARGMNIENAVVIIDEAQNLSRIETRAILTRMCENVKVFSLGSSNQIDNKYLNRWNNGLNWCVKSFKGENNYGHLVLRGSRSRGPITDLCLRTNL